MADATPRLCGAYEKSFENYTRATNKVYVNLVGRERQILLWDGGEWGKGTKLNLTPLTPSEQHLEHTNLAPRKATWCRFTLSSIVVISMDLEPAVSATMNKPVDG